MKYYNLIETLKNLSTSHEVIQEFGEGDVYEYMNSGNHKYPCLFMTMSTINSDENSTDYNFTLFYIDRLTDDNSNRIYVQSTGISVIKQVLQQIVSLNGDVELTSANYTLFTEKFADYCGGAFCEVVLSDVLQNTTNDTDDCDETDFGDLQISITKNGVYNVRGYSTAVVKIDSLVLVKMTQNEYDNLEEYDKFTVYIILDDKNVITRIYQGTEILYDITQKNYVTFTAEEANSTIGLTKLSTNQTLEYRTDTTNWNTMDTSTLISLSNVGDKVYIRGILSANNSSSDYTKFKMTGKIAASGNCNAIWNYQDLEAPLKARCGRGMFQGCTSLVTAPELPATELVEGCYYYMFNYCKGLTEAPTLPATTLASSCYQYMFENCTSLRTAPTLPATTLANSCYQYMFSNCAALTTAPTLPATSLQQYCYSHMFDGCTSLTTAPELPATELAPYCYQLMFYGCTSLVEAPELPATTLANSCYVQMFGFCTKLNKITCLATNISATSCTHSWLYKVSSSGTFIKHPDMNDWTSGTSGIPSGWTVEDYVG